MELEFRVKKDNRIIEVETYTDNQPRVAISVLTESRIGTSITLNAKELDTLISFLQSSKQVVDVAEWRIKNEPVAP